MDERFDSASGMVGSSNLSEELESDEVFYGAAWSADSSRVATLDTDLMRKTRLEIVRDRVVVGAGKILIPVLLVVSWQIASSTIADPVFVSSPALVAVRLGEWVTDGTLAHHTLVTLWEAFIGFLIGAATGGIAGLIMGRVRFVGEILEPYVLAVDGMPKLALVSLFIIWFGVGVEMKMAFSATLVFFLVFINTFIGVRSVPHALENVMGVMGASRARTIASIVLPAAALWVFNGLKISLPFALLGAVTGDLLAGSEGLGFLVIRSQALFDLTGLYSALVVLLIVSTALMGILRLVQSHVLAYVELEGDRVL